jgi:hypothetical protein
MTDSDDDILTGEIGKLGRKLPGLTGLGASIGAQFAARFLPTETFTEKLVLKLTPEQALKLAFSMLAKLGKMQIEHNEPPYPFLKAVIGSGFLNLNPAIVYLEILKRDAAGCEITITAAAKEGLIKQRTAAKAVQRVISALKNFAPLPDPRVKLHCLHPPPPADSGKGL